MLVLRSPAMNEKVVRSKYGEDFIFITETSRHAQVSGILAFIPSGKGEYSRSFVTFGCVIEVKQVQIRASSYLGYS